MNYSVSLSCFSRPRVFAFCEVFKWSIILWSVECFYVQFYLCTCIFFSMYCWIFCFILIYYEFNFVVFCIVIVDWWDLMRWTKTAFAITKKMEFFLKYRINSSIYVKISSPTPYEPTFMKPPPSDLPCQEFHEFGLMIGLKEKLMRPIFHEIYSWEALIGMKHARPGIIF